MNDGIIISLISLLGSGCGHRGEIKMTRFNDITFEE